MSKHPNVHFVRHRIFKKKENMMSYDTQFATPAFPLAMSIMQAVEWSGLSRSEIYRRIKSGDLRAKKLRSRTLVMTDSIRQLIDSLPDMNPCVSSSFPANDNQQRKPARQASKTLKVLGRAS
jgi:predicted DNA-binding transcriptional regulator AlpA